MSDQPGTSACVMASVVRIIDWDNYFRDTLIEIRKILDERVKTAASAH